MNASDIESNALEAESVASFLLRPVIVHESIYAFTQYAKPGQLFSSPG